MPSKVTLTITEAPGRNLVVQVESEPPLPLRDGNLDWERADSPQTAAVLAATYIESISPEAPGETITAENALDAARKVNARFGLDA
jgi:hypothetical protein